MQIKKESPVGTGLNNFTQVQDRDKDSDSLANFQHPLTVFANDAEENIKKGEKETYEEMFQKSKLDQTGHYPDPIPLMYLVQGGENYPHRTLKSFSLQQGKQKSKKTTALIIEVGSYISPVTLKQQNDNIYFKVVTPGKVIFFDNEQGESYAAKSMKLALKLAGLHTSPNLFYCDLREYNPTDRFNIIKAGIKATEGVKWVIIDGIVDLMNDFMAADEGHLIITDILKLCSEFNIHVTGVLHQNKGTSKDARAHVGSIASQKCEVEIMAERDPNDPTLSIISAKESRGLPFEDFAIKWEKGSLPCIVQEWSPSKSKAEKKGKILDPSEADINLHIEVLKEAYKVNKEPKLGEFTLNLKNALTQYHIKMNPEIYGGGWSAPKSIADAYRTYYINEEMIITQGKTPHTKYILSE